MARKRTGNLNGRPRKRMCAEDAARALVAGEYDANPVAQRFDIAVGDYAKQHFATLSLTTSQRRQFADKVEEALYALPMGGSLREKFGATGRLSVLLRRRHLKQASDLKTRGGLLRRELVRIGAYYSHSEARWVFPHAG